MDKFDCVLFDLDGTLIDSTPLILESFRQTFLYHFNENKSDEELIRFLGIPLRDTMNYFYPGMDEILVKTYRELNETRHDSYIGVFTGIYRMLGELERRNVMLGVVTSKMRRLAMRGMQIFDIQRFMKIFVAYEDTLLHKPYGAPIEKALEYAGITDRSRVLYVGDSTYDILCARNAGVKSAVVSWSSVSREDLSVCGPDIYLEEAEDILKYV